MNSPEIDTQLPSQHLSHQYIKDEIDLLELFAVIWRGKLLICSVVAVCAVSAFVYLKLQPSIYRIDTSLDITAKYDISAIQPSILDGGDYYQVELLEGILVYQTALNSVRSSNVLRQFWEASTSMKLPAFSSSDENENEKKFLEFVDSLKANLPDLDIGAGTADNVSTLSIESDRPEEAVELMGGYTEYLNTWVVKQYVKQLVNGLQSSLSQLEFDYQALMRKEKLKIDDELLRLREAYDLADALSIIETPYEQVENIELKILDDRKYLLGTTVLLQEVKSLEQRKDKAIQAFVPQLRDMELWQEQMEHDLTRLKSNEDQVRAFVLVSPPESSMLPVKPRKALIFIAVIFASGILAVIAVFVLHGIMSYQKRSNS